MDKPMNTKDTSMIPGERMIDRSDHPPAGYIKTNSAEAETIEGGAQLKIGRSQGFEVYCDESGRIGGEGKYPPPMAYFAMGTAF